MKLKKSLLLAAILGLGIAAHPALANSTGGCGDASPENPTVILAGLASGAYGLTELRRRIKVRRSRRDK